MSLNRCLKINCLLADSQGGELHIEGKDQTLLYEARDTRSETTKEASDVAVVTELKSDQAVRIGVGALVDLQGAKVTAPKIQFERAAGADQETAGVLRLGAAIEQSSSSVERKEETAKLWQKQEGSGRTEQTAVMTQLQGQVTFGEGLQMAVDVPQTQGQTQAQGQPLTGANLQQQIEQLAGQSGLGYLQQLQNNPAVKFNEVKLAVATGALGRGWWARPPPPRLRRELLSMRGLLHWPRKRRLVLPTCEHPNPPPRPRASRFWL